MNIPLLLAVAAIAVIAWLVMDWLKVPEPINRIVKVALVFVVVIVVVDFILKLAGQAGFIR